MALVMKFHLPVIQKLLIIFVLVWLAFKVLKQIYNNTYYLIFELKSSLWKFSEDGVKWQYFDGLSAIYVNRWFVWIVLSNQHNHSKGLIIGSDSLLDERFMQLRRCILCPNLLHLSQVN